MSLENYFQDFRENIIGRNQTFVGPFGEKKIIYADWVASGRLYNPIEKLLQNEIFPFVANTHTETNTTGATMNIALHEALHIIKNSVNASEDDVPVHDANWYSYSKVISEPYIELRLDKYLILRATHKPRPFIFDKALISQVGNFDYIDVVSKIYIDLIEGNAQGIYNVGTELKTMYDLAKQSRDDVVPTNEKFYDTMPLDVSMDLNKLKKFYDKK